MAQNRRHSLSDNSSPSSEISEGSEALDTSANEWQSESDNRSSIIFDNVELRIKNLSLDASLETEVTENERMQIESFFSGLGTEVFVASSLANLYERVKKKEWKLIFTGVPVLLYDKGSTRSRTQPRVTFVLAERGTCFALWKDTIDNLSSYKISGPAFHTMCLSTDHSNVIGFSFDSKEAAVDFWQNVERLISNPENIALSVPGRKRKTQKKIKPKVLPTKSQISLPCQFEHITKVTAGEKSNFYSLQAFIEQEENFEN